jgi:hypothetical protein
MWMAADAPMKASEKKRAARTYVTFYPLNYPHTTLLMWIGFLLRWKGNMFAFCSDVKRNGGRVDFAAAPH